MIKEVYLFTNRNVAAFDENGEQVADVQAALSCYPGDCGQERAALRQIIADNPVVYLAKWHKWRHEISIKEFCYMLGHGQWHWATIEMAA